MGRRNRFTIKFYIHWQRKSRKRLSRYNRYWFGLCKNNYFIDIDTLQFRLEEIKYSKVGEINRDMLNRLTIVLSSIIKYSVNLLFNRGLNLPLILGLDIDFGKIGKTLCRSRIEPYFRLMNINKIVLLKYRYFSFLPLIINKLW